MNQYNEQMEEKFEDNTTNAKDRLCLVSKMFAKPVHDEKFSKNYSKRPSKAMISESMNPGSVMNDSKYANSVLKRSDNFSSEIYDIKLSQNNQKMSVETGNAKRASTFKSHKRIK